MSTFQYLHDALKRVKNACETAYKLGGFSVFTDLVAQGSVWYVAAKFTYENTFIAYVITWIILVIWDRFKK